MAIKFKMVPRKNLGDDQKEHPEKQYAQMVCGDLVTFEELIEEVTDSSGVSSASVKAVLDRVNVVSIRHLRNGRRVNLGELGNLRFSFGSDGVTDAKDFDVSMIREPRVCFFPGKALRIAKSRTNFEKVASEDKNEGGGSGEDDRPVIE
nr:HU family DNA-binding protein [Parabacteroides goldsteinii]